MNIDFKGGKVSWDTITSLDLSKDLKAVYYSQDLLQVEYDNCLIDLGYYGSEKGCFCIIVINKPPKDIEAEDWTNPFTKIVCPNVADVENQLQRAIDIYPMENFK
jgi:hypothetical protein